MANFKFRGNVSKALYEGFTPNQIAKELKKEYAMYRRTLKRTIVEGKKFDENIKSYITPIYNKTLKDQSRDLTYLNPAREQLKKLKSLKVKPSYQKPVLIYRANDEGKLIVPSWDWVKTDITKSQQNSLSKFREDYSKLISREIRRYNRYGKVLNLNALTVKVRGEEISLTQLYKDYLSSQDKYYKVILRKKFNYAIKKLREIQVSKQVMKGMRVYRGKLEKASKNGIDLEAPQGEINFHSTDKNGNILGWRIVYSPPNIIAIEGVIVQRGRDEIVWQSHIMQLRGQGVDIQDPYFLKIWNHLKAGNFNDFITGRWNEGFE